MELTKAKIEWFNHSSTVFYCCLGLSQLVSKNIILNHFVSFWYILCIFAVTVRTTLPTRTASQGASFAFKKLYNTPAMPLLLSTLSGFFRDYV